MKRWRQATRRFLSRARELVPLTALGLVLVGIAGGTLAVFGYGALDLVLLVVSLFSLAFATVALLAVLVTAVTLRVRHRPLLEARAVELETGRWSPTGHAPPNLRFVPLVEVQSDWAEPPSVEARTSRRGGRVYEEILPRGRGEHLSIERRVVVRDVFGLAAVTLRFREPAALSILPHLGALSKLTPLTALARGEEHAHPMGIDEGDRVDMRRYAPGDPARFIHWKTFGRTRKLMVRVQERALSPAHRVAAFLIAGEGDEASAAAARMAIETGGLGVDYRFGADGHPAPQTSRRGALDAVVRSASHRGASARSLAAFVDSVEREGPASLLLFAPPTPGEWTRLVADVARHRPGRARALIAVDGLEALAPPRASVARRLLLRPPPRAGASRGALDAVLRALASAGVEVTVVDRVTGRVLVMGARAAQGKVAA